ncbi:MAG: DUF86 domain-containing protein [Acidimicrobiales bacterium]
MTDDLAWLGSRATCPPGDLLEDADGLRALKYTFVTAIEGCLNVAQHMCASEGWGPPSSNADAMRVLGRHRVLAPELAEQLSRAVGFRNVLVHGYVDVDDGVVVGFLDRIGDLAAFVGQVTAWMALPAG